MHFSKESPKRGSDAVEMATESKEEIRARKRHRARENFVSIAIGIRITERDKYTRSPRANRECVAAAAELLLYVDQTGILRVCGNSRRTEQTDRTRPRQSAIASANRIVSQLMRFDSMYSLTVLTYWVKRFNRTDVCTPVCSLKI